MKFDFARRQEATRIAKAFRSFVKCSETRYLKDFYSRYGLHNCTFHNYMKWANENIPNFNFEKLKRELKGRWN
jgi:hypothetical protein